MHTRRVLLFTALAVLLAPPAIAQTPEIQLTISEALVGQWVFAGSGTANLTVAPAQLLNFSWSADAGTATVTGYRYGWDVLDTGDPNDLGWAIEWSLDAFSAPAHSFAAGLHKLVVQAKDDLGHLTTATILIQVDPNVAAGAVSWGWLKGAW